jgi:hypothetical protein
MAGRDAHFGFYALVFGAFVALARIARRRLR